MFYNLRMTVHNLFVFSLLLVLMFILGEVIVVTRQRDKLFPHQFVLQTTLPAWYVCADLCSRMKVCKSMNFIASTKTCQILDVAPTCQESLVDSIGDTFLERSAIPDNLAGKCLSHNCNTNEICIEQKAGHTCAPIEKKKITPTASKPKDCSKLPVGCKSGVYRIFLSRSDCTGFEVFCFIDTDGQGWTVFQNRFDGKTSFDRTWTEYEDGFGSARGEYWMGNKRLHQMTLENTCTLRVSFTLLIDGNHKHADYSNFRVGDASTKYEITKVYTSGWDIMLYVGKQFTTKDNTEYDCVKSGGEGGWWNTADCNRDNSNLNAIYDTLKVWTIPISHPKMMIRCSKTKEEL